MRPFKVISSEIPLLTFNPPLEETSGDAPQGSTFCGRVSSYPVSAGRLKASRVSLLEAQGEILSRTMFMSIYCTAFATDLSVPAPAEEVPQPVAAEAEGDAMVGRVSSCTSPSPNLRLTGWNTAPDDE